MIADLMSLLGGDAVFTGLLTGGLYEQGEVGELSRQLTPAAFDGNKEVKPTCLLKMLSQDFLTGNGFRGASILLFELYFYQRIQYGVIDQARERAFDLLHNQYVAPSVAPYPSAPLDTAWYVRHDSDILRTEDNALNCRLSVSRYLVHINRRGTERVC